MPQAYIERLKKVEVVIGHERCASSNFSESGTLVVCALHHYGLAKSVLHQGRYYFGCRECIEALPSTWAKTEERARGLYVDIAP